MQTSSPLNPAWTCTWAHLLSNCCSASLSTHGSAFGLQSFDSCRRRLRDLLQNTEDSVHLVRPLLESVRNMRANISIVGLRCCGTHYKCHEACEHESNTSVGKHLDSRYCCVWLWFPKMSMPQALEPDTAVSRIEMLSNARVAFVL